MKNKNNIKKNYLFNLSFQIFKIIIPIITAPYISRVIGSEGIGQYSFTFSIVTYFTLLASLGFEVYAQREIAKNQDNIVEQTKVFWEVLIAKVISSTISLAFFFLLTFCGPFNETYRLLLFILSLNILSVALDVTYLFQGNEQFGLIALRNILVKIIGVIFIFVFVKNRNDVWIYTLIQSSVLVVSSISLWTRLSKFLCRISIKDLNVTRHIVPTLKLFIPTIAISVYTMLDKTLIGTLVQGINEYGQAYSDLENGYYEQAEKIVKIGLSVITSLGAVMIPRNSQTVASGDFETFKKNINDTLHFVLFIGMPIMFGIAGIATNFSPWFFGGGFEKVPYLIMLFCPLVIIIGFSNVLGLQYLLPLNEDKKYTISIVCGALSNLFLNLLLIPIFWAYGACFATVSAELIVTLVMFFFARKDLSIKKLGVNFLKYFCSGLLMFLIVFITQQFLPSSIINTLLLIVEGIAAYLIILVILRDAYLFNAINKIKDFIFKRR